MTQPPVPPPPNAPPPPPGGAPLVPPDERFRLAWQRRPETDYIFDFWTALGWSVLTCGVYGLYVVYQLVRRSREHNRRRLELLEAATALAWQRTQEAGLADELRPRFEHLSGELATLRQLTADFRDPAAWVVLAAISGIASVVAAILLDTDLVRHEAAERAIEQDLAEVFARLGTPVELPPAGPPKQRHNDVGRIVALVFSLGVYGLWWEYDLMTEGNRHFVDDAHREDALAAVVRRHLGA